MFEVIPGNDNHGPYIIDENGETVCDFYFMQTRAGGLKRPYAFPNAKKNAKKICDLLNKDAGYIS